MSGKPPTGVGATSLLTAYARAQESRRTDAIVSDPWAEAYISAATGHRSGPLPRLGFADERGSSAIWQGFSAYLALRTLYFDEMLLESTHGAIRQIVILAAGLDSRACRLSLPADCVVYEVDTKEVFEFKNSVSGPAAATCKRVTIPADLREGWDNSLVSAGFRKDEPTVWVAEGLLMYLSPSECDALLTLVTALSAPHSRLIMEYPRQSPPAEFFLPFCVDAEDRAVAAQLAEMLTSGPDGAPESWLERFGWTAEDTTTVVEEGIRVGRTLPPVMTEGTPRYTGWLVTALLSR